MGRARRAIALLTAAALFLPSLPASARTYTPLETETIVAGAAIGALDLVLTLADTVIALRGRKPGQRYAGAEMTLMTVQLTLGISILASLGSLRQTTYDQFGNPIVLDSGADLLIPVGILATVLAFGLGMHALWALRQPVAGAHSSLQLTPTVAATSQQVILGVAGRF